MDDANETEIRFDLNEGELLYLIAMHVAAGWWEDFGNSEERAKSFLMSMIKVLKAHGPEAIRDLVWTMQNTLMAQRKDDFQTIQMQPPFIPCVRNHLEILDEWWVSDGEQGFNEMWDMVFRSGWRAEVVPHEIIRLSGGRGDSAETALRVHAPDAETRICAQYWYLHYTYGRRNEDWKLGIQGLTVPDERGREFDVMNVILPDGEENKFYFIRDPKAVAADAESSEAKDPESKFTHEELVCVTTTYLVAGDWKPLTEPEGKALLLKLIRNSKANGFDYARSIFVQAQNAVMAVGGKSFTEMQKGPPFSQFGLMNLVTLQDAWLKNGDDGFEVEWQRIFAPGWQKGVIPNRIIGLTGGPGDCEDTAFRVHAPHVEARIAAEYWYLYYTYGRRDVDWEYWSQALTPADELGRRFDIIEIKLPNGEIKPTFFVRDSKYSHV